jgi:hypothetical protein
VTSELYTFLDMKVRSLEARSRRLARLDRRSVGFRPQDMPYAPSAAHFRAANVRLSGIDRLVRTQLDALARDLRQPGVESDELLRKAALVEREIDRARRTYGLFFDVFIQRGTMFGPALAACDMIAADCFQAVRRAAPGLIHGPLLKPVTYLEHSFSPATFRRGVMLRRLLGEQNPFPLVRIPYERIESPWGMGVVLHEIGHNLQADLGVWQETQQAVQRRVFQVSRNPWLTRIWTRWHKEIFADLIAILLGGPASARSMKDFLAYPAARVLTFRPLGVHPTPYLRMFIQAEMLRRMGFRSAARRIQRVWSGLYDAALQQGRVPANLIGTATRIIPHVIDEVAYQPRRGLAQRALVDVVPFTATDERTIQRAAPVIARGELPADLPPRFAVSASRYALEGKMAAPAVISRTVLMGLAQRGARERTTASAAIGAVA